jgi:hypothetical protein
MLAARLLEQGHDQVVLEYLKRAGDVWCLDKRINGWIESITAREQPELSPMRKLFGAPEEALWYQTHLALGVLETPVDFDDPDFLARFRVRIRGLMESHRERN